jgi:hypothetical protein
MKFLLLLLAIPLLLSADVVSTCTATATDPLGNTSPVACLLTPASTPSAYFATPTLTDRHPNLLNLFNYSSGGATTTIPGASISVSLDQEVSAVGSYTIYGGSGNGELVLQDNGFSTFPACYSNGISGVCPHMTWTSNVLPVAGTFTPIYVPFTFGVSFSISVDAKMILSASDPDGVAGLSWEALIEDDLEVIGVLDSNGNPEPNATFIAPVPEPSSILLFGTVLVAIALTLKRELVPFAKAESCRFPQGGF